LRHREGRGYDCALFEDDAMGLLQDKQVAITGKLALMTKGEAVHMIRTCGGEFVTAVDSQTAMLVVGQGSSPIQRNGQISKMLQDAKRLKIAGAVIAIVGEAEFLEQLGSVQNIRRLYTLAHLSELTGLKRGRLRSWIQAGLIVPVEMVAGIGYFDFRQVVNAKTLFELTSKGVSTARLKRSLEQLKAILPNVEQPLDQLALLEQNGQILVRVEAGLMEPSGQMRFDFSEEEPLLSLEQEDASGWNELACKHEAAGFLAEAVHSYHRALLVGGPDADICYRLAQVLCKLGRRDEASVRIRQVIELDPQRADAWNSLGVVLRETNRRDEAIRAFQRAIEFRYAEAHYHLAELYDEQGRREDARDHWLMYLQYEPRGAQSRHAKRQLG
jgi:tetratricopeptide (TPR) repeat protein